MVRLLIFSLTLFIGSQSWAAECGLFRVVKGKVTYKQKNKKKFRKARINKKVCQGDTIKTAADSRAKIVMADENELNISPNTELKIEQYVNNDSNGSGKVLLNVVYGKIRSNVKRKYKDSKRNHYRVKTKSAVAGVRGTEFLASYNTSTQQSKVVTFEGEVAVGNMQGGSFVAQVTVKPGQFTSNSPGTKPHPAKNVPPQEFAQMNRESNVSDSPRDVSSDAGKPQAKEKKKLKEKKNKPKKQEPKRDKAKANQPDDQASTDGSGNADGGGLAGDGGAPTLGDSGSEGGRDLASVDNTDPLGLPPPTLDDLPSGDDLGVVELPRIPTLDPIIGTVPECLTCNDAIISKKVKVVIVPVIAN